MAVVVPGTTRSSCDAKCHGAESPRHECQCEWEGKNHGIFFREDKSNANDAVAAEVEEGRITQAQGFLL